MSPPARRAAQRLRDGRAKSRKSETPPSVSPKRTQRERLTDAIIELSARDGYPSVSVAQVSSHARVSSATFYELFDGKEDCLLAAYQSVAERLVERIRERLPAVLGSDWRVILHAALDSLLSAVREDPDGARLLFVEAAAGGELIDRERKRVLGVFEGLAQAILNDTSETDEPVDLPATAFVGALRSIISRRLRTNAADQLPSMTDDMIAWIASYAIPPGASSWSTGPTRCFPQRARQAPKRACARAAACPGAGTGCRAGVVARSQRTRIIYATAEVTMAKGYASTTVADIVAKAGVARDVFYEHFTDKQHAFLEAQQHPTQHIIDACASAYFSAPRLARTRLVGARRAARDDRLSARDLASSTRRVLCRRSRSDPSCRGDHTLVHDLHGGRL